ncbi:hypothetical protein HMPREF9374_0871 [Desmospora sp. 8437]|nr:hypothetical protein HMPREF9374_0871 [Desmospora sp. 8437]
MSLIITIISKGFKEKKEGRQGTGGKAFSANFSAGGLFPCQ